MNTEIQTAIKYLGQKDKILEKIIDIVGACTLAPSRDYFKSLTKSIIYQQLSNKTAKKIYERFESELKKEICPNKVLQLTQAQIKKIGISPQKHRYLTDLSQRFANKEIQLDTVVSNEDIIEQLTKIKGIGRWSAEMFLIFCLNKLDILPLDDIGFRRAIRINYKLKEIPDLDEIHAITDKWKPYRSIAVWYLWQSMNIT